MRLFVTLLSLLLPSLAHADLLIIEAGDLEISWIRGDTGPGDPQPVVQVWDGEGQVPVDLELLPDGDVLIAQQSSSGDATQDGLRVMDTVSFTVGPVFSTAFQPTALWVDGADIYGGTTSGQVQRSSSGPGGPWTVTMELPGAVTSLARHDDQMYAAAGQTIYRTPVNETDPTAWVEVITAGSVGTMYPLSSFTGLLYSATVQQQILQISAPATDSPVTTLLYGDVYSIEGFAALPYNELAVVVSSSPGRIRHARYNAPAMSEEWLVSADLSYPTEVVHGDFCLPFDDDADGVTICDGDCDDRDPLTSPSAPELCDGLDNDCDGAVPGDEGDGDRDGARPCDGDCDDSDPWSRPGNYDVCDDGVDQDCDGADAIGDADGDGYTGSSGCTVPITDCDDGDPDVHPGAEDTCNDGVDQDCDGNDYLIDNDGDGALALGWPCFGDDCNDGAATVYPGAEELCDDSVDQDCDGDDLMGDRDGDGYKSTICQGPDCDDDRWEAHPEAPELCNGLDDNCNGTTADETLDLDADGYLACEDCDDGDAGKNPGVDIPEGCSDPVDSDCDGAAIEDPFADDQDGDGFARPHCGGDDCDDSDPNIHPGATEEACWWEWGVEPLDQDCDGVTPVVADADGDGYAHAGCDDDGLELDCDDDDPNVNPEAEELCDAIDQNCDGDLVRRHDGDDRYAFFADTNADGVPECGTARFVDPGIIVSCSQGGGGAGALAIFAALLLVPRRRRGWAPLLLLLALPSVASAQAITPVEAAKAAYQVNEEHCAATVDDRTTVAAEALARATEVYADVSATYDASPEPYLLYWRGVLALCIGQDQRGLNDLIAFLDTEGIAASATDQYRDARRRVRIVQRQALTSAGVWDPHPWPLLAFGLGGGVLGTLGGEDSAYGALATDVSVRLARPLRLALLVRSQWGERHRDNDGEEVEPAQRSFLLTTALGVALRNPGPVRGLVFLGAQVAPNPDGSVGGPVLVGPDLMVGFEVVLGREVLGVRLALDAAYMHPLFALRPVLQVVFNL